MTSPSTTGPATSRWLVPDIREILACPRCRSPLTGDRHPRCTACDADFARTGSGALDLRLTEPQRVDLQVMVGRPLPAPDEQRIAPLRAHPEPEVDFTGLPVPRHLSPTLLSHLPAAQPGGRALDLGCGTGVHRGVCERAGFTYVGLDSANPAADVLGEAHALPFLDASLEFVLSIAVFEHLRLPALAAREVRRVMTDGALFLGTVAFLEPFHHNSFFHHSHLGIWSTLEDAGLEVLWVAPSRDWTVLYAQATNALFPGIGTRLARLAITPAYALHRLLWWFGRRRHPQLTEAHRLRRTTGAFTFMARKTAPA